jgi:hypothetical protein
MHLTNNEKARKMNSFLAKLKLSYKEVSELTTPTITPDIVEAILIRRDDVYTNESSLSIIDTAIKKAIERNREKHIEKLEALLVKQKK